MALHSLSRCIGEDRNINGISYTCLHDVCTTAHTAKYIPHSEWIMEHNTAPNTREGIRPDLSQSETRKLLLPLAGGAIRDTTTNRL